MQDDKIKNKKFEQEDEEYYTYMPRKKTMDSLNTDKSKFDTDIFEGINSKKSVFDRSAVFHTDV